MAAQHVMCQLEDLKLLVEELIPLSSPEAKIALLENSKLFPKELLSDTPLAHLYRKSTEVQKAAIAAILCIGEANTVFHPIFSCEFDERKWSALLGRLVEIDLFYEGIGGLAGYHFHVMRLLKEKGKIPQQAPGAFLKPAGFELVHPGYELNQYVKWGIEHLPRMAEIFPVGGAGDRLGLKEEKTDVPLPVAELHFCGRTLLEGLIRDVQAKEYLYYKLFHRQLTTPIAMMTSEEKNNHQRIIRLCEQSKWFGRPQSAFMFFTQPMVPVITEEGHWSMASSYQITLKPGGHGVVWKLALQSGVFKWFEECQRVKALVRQINNPMAGTDSGILAFAGIGCKLNKVFGFASCPRLLNAAEGMIVLVCTPTAAGYSYRISNIEYTDFANQGLEDLPESSDVPFSKYPANTNILFVDLKEIAGMVPSHSVPGMMVNFKSLAPYTDCKGRKREVLAGRLESMMQNISDGMVEEADHRLTDRELLDLKTYVTYGERRKTISVTKNAFDPAKSIKETSLGCFYEMLQNHRTLLADHCGISVPPLCSETEYLERGPNWIFLYHSALGPLYSVIAQKLRGGRLHPDASLILEIAEVYLVDCDFQGALRIYASDVLGHRNAEGQIEYSSHGGKCTLKNVTVANQGIDRSAPNHYWKDPSHYKEKMEILLNGNGEFHAENIRFEGNYRIEVPAGWRWTAYQKGGEVCFKKEPIRQPTWYWEYAFDKQLNVALRFIQTGPVSKNSSGLKSEQGTDSTERELNNGN